MLLFFCPIYRDASMPKTAIAGSTGLRTGLFQPFYVLSAFLLLLFATGGSSWPFEAQLIVLRPAAFLIAAWGLATMTTQHWREYRTLWIIFFAITLLIATHLVTLPFAWWSRLPGRDVLVQIDAAANLGQIARPLSMQPEATMNALLSMSVPLAVLSIGVQLDQTGQNRTAGLLIVLIAISALVGLLQLSGVRLALYETVTAIRPSGLFNNRNHQGALLAIAFPLIVLAWKGGYLSHFSPHVERICAACLGVVVLPLAFVTGSRSGLALCGVSLVLALIELPRPSSRGGKDGKLGLIAALTGTGVLAAVTLFAGRAESIARLQNSSSDVRFSLWQNIVEFLPNYMPWGSGIGSYAAVFQIHEQDRLLNPTFSNHAHNELLEIALTAGIPGLILFGLVAAAFAVGAAHAWQSKGNYVPLARAGTIVILILALASTTDYPLRTPILAGVLTLAAVWLSRAFRPGPTEQDEFGGN